MRRKQTFFGTMRQRARRQDTAQGLWRVSLALAFLVAIVAGCDALTPRKPPPPCDPALDPNCRFVPFDDPLSPEVVRNNIIAAIEGFRVQPNYELSLASVIRGEPPFEYIPEPGLNEVFPGFFDGWNEAREVQFMLDLLQSGAERPRTVDFNVTRFVDTGFFPDTDRARYDVEYDLLLTFVDSTQDPPVETTRRYCATALWDFSGGNESLWRLQRWEEISPTGLPGCLGSMGLLRATTGAGR